ncbi:hypothetical protein SDC9_57895 [bioreactor metagenome]|uniref:Uncharacterized protein n=1 Tax=bioreactor metagenome TaxID=1076179 RepID=A0A644X645_9ZZZZ
MQPGVHDEAIAFRDVDFTFQIADIILNAVEAYSGQINIGMDANATHRNQLADFHGSLNVELVRCIFEYVQDDGVVICALGRGGEPQRKLRLEIGQNLLICIGRGMVSLVNDEIVKIAVLELFQIQSHTLDAAADYIGVLLLDGVHITAYGDAGP